MDQTLFILIILSVILVMTFLVVVFVVPTSSKAKRRKKRREKEGLTEEHFLKLQKNNKHLEGVIGALRKKILIFESGEKNWGKKFAVEEVKVRKLQDKLLQERQWQEKETEKYNKKAQEIQVFKNELKIVQDSLSKEHAQTIRLEGSIRDFKIKVSDINSQRRSLDVENMQLKGKLNGLEDKVRELKKDNTALSKQKNEATFVAKSDYLKLEQKLKETENELRVVKKNSKL